jgi:hypothetical protein
MSPAQLRAARAPAAAGRRAGYKVHEPDRWLEQHRTLISNGPQDRLLSAAADVAVRRVLVPAAERPANPAARRWAAPEHAPPLLQGVRHRRRRGHAFPPHHAYRRTPGTQPRTLGAHHAHPPRYNAKDRRSSTLAATPCPARTPPTDGPSSASRATAGSRATRTRRASCLTAGARSRTRSASRSTRRSCTSCPAGRARSARSTSPRARPTRST